MWFCKFWRLLAFGIEIIVFLLEKFDGRFSQEIISGEDGEENSRIEMGSQWRVVEIDKTDLIFEEFQFMSTKMWVLSLWFSFFVNKVKK